MALCCVRGFLLTRFIPDTIDTHDIVGPDLLILEPSNISMLYKLVRHHTFQLKSGLPEKRTPKFYTHQYY